VRTRLIFVRHGESVHSIERIVGGPRGCRGLTESGREQASRLAVRLADELAAAGQVAVYSSVLPRAVQTAVPVAAALGADVVEDCGVFRPFEEGSETWAALVVRVSRSIVDIAHQHRGGTVVLVGHTETVEASFHALAAQPLYRAFDLAVDPASVTEWATDDDPTGWPPARWTLCRVNAR
jgi:broad specificity phosphatase PhoE